MAMVEVGLELLALVIWAQVLGGDENGRILGRAKLLKWLGATAVSYAPLVEHCFLPDLRTTEQPVRVPRKLGSMRNYPGFRKAKLNRSVEAGYTLPHY